MLRKFRTGAAGPTLGVVIAIATALWVALSSGAQAG